MSQLADPNDLEIITSMCYSDCLRAYPQNSAFGINCESNNCYMLSYHRDRLLAAARAFDWDKLAGKLEGDGGLCFIDNGIQAHIKHIPEEVVCEKAYKIRLAFNRETQLMVTMTLAPEITESRMFPRSLSMSSSISTLCWRIYLSPIAINTDLHTKHKTTLRAPYDRARSIFLSADAFSLVNTEVLIQNEECEIMEGSLTTPYFYRTGNWITPAEDCGGNIGTTRRWALEQGICVEGIVKVQDLIDGEMIWLSNGVRGWFPGKLDLNTRRLQLEEL